MNALAYVLWYVFWLPTLITMLSLIGIIRILFRLSKGPFFPGAFNATRSRFFQYFLGWSESLINELGGNKMGKIVGIKPGEKLETDLGDTIQKDVPPNQRAVFYYIPLGAFEYARIQDQLYQVTGFGKQRQERLLTGSQQIEVLVKGLKGWRNFNYGDGSEVPWEDPGDSKNDKERREIMLRNVERIPQDTRAELADIIRGESSAESD